MAKLDAKSNNSNKDFSMSASIKEAFFEWLSAGNIKNHSPSVCVNCLEKISKYALNKKIIHASIWSISHPSVFKPIYNKLLESNLLRVSDKNTYNVFTVAGQMYLKFLEENTRVEDVDKLTGLTPVADILDIPSMVSKKVDFSKPELCVGCAPISCFVEGNNVVTGSWRDLLISLIEKFIDDKNIYIVKLCKKGLSPRSSRPFLLKDRPSGAARQVSNGYWVFMNYNIPMLVELIGKLCCFCGLNLDCIEITYAPKSYKKRVIPEQGTSIKQQIRIPQTITQALTSDYRHGFKFNSTAIRLLSDKAGLDIDDIMQKELKRIMFRRKDDVYFLIESIMNHHQLKNISNHADFLIKQYNCFELQQLYLYAKNNTNINYIRDIVDFEDLFKFIYNGNICSTNKYGVRIARVQGKQLDELLGIIAQKIVALTCNDFEGVIREDDLKVRFDGFSSDFLSAIIKEYAKELVKMQINEIVCYETLDALGLPDGFPDLLDEILSQIYELVLSPSEEVLHTVLSFKMGVNFKDEYNIPDDKTFRRLISIHYKSNPPREWKGRIFAEVSN